VGFWVWGFDVLGLGAWDLGLGALGLGPGACVLCFVFCVLCFVFVLEFVVCGLGFRSGFGSWVSSFGFKDEGAGVGRTRSYVRLIDFVYQG